MAAGKGLGTLTLSLAIQMGAFTSGLDKAGRQLDSKTRAMQRRMDAVGKAIGRSLLAGIGVAAAGMAIYVRNTIEAEKVQAQLVSRLKDTGQVAGRTLQQLNAQAQRLQGLTIFDDESIGQAQAALLTFTQIQGVNFDKAVESATDLATVMGTDLESAARTLGKALADPERGIGQLRKAGISLTEEQQDMVKQLVETGRQADAQGVLLDALASKMGTAAEASRDTLGGALEALQNSFNNLLEGDANDNGLRGARDAIEHFNTTLNDPGIKQGADNMVRQMSFIAEKALATATAISNLIAGVDAFGRSAAQAKYDADLLREHQLKDQLAHGTSPFDPEFGRSQADLKREITALHASNQAYLARLQQAPASIPSSTQPAFPLNGTTLIAHDPDLWKTGGTGRSGASRAAADAMRREQEAADALRDAVQKVTAAHGDFDAQVKRVAYDLKDDLGKATEDYQDALAQLNESAKVGEVSAADLADGQRLLREQYEKTTAAIKDRQDTGARELEQMRQQLDLLNLQTQAERVRAQFLIDNPTATDAQADAAARMDAQIDSTRRMISTVDEFRASFADSVVDVVTGAASIADAFKSLADTVVAQIARIIAQQLTTSLFGEPGTTAGGSQGGWLSKIFSIFLPHHAAGTDFAPGGPSIVGEHGPELVNLPRGSQVVPNHKLAGGVTLNMYVTGGGNPRETAMQSAKELRRTLAFAMRS